jgi:hypothetical protein
MRRALIDMQAVSRSTPISDHCGIVALRQSLTEACDASLVTISCEPVYGLVAYPRVLDLLKATLTDKARIQF